MTWVSLNTAATLQMKTPWTSTSTPQRSLLAALQVLLGKLVKNWVMALKPLLKELPACTIDFMVVAIMPVWGKTVKKWTMTDITQTMTLNGCPEGNTELELDCICCFIQHVKGTTNSWICLIESASDTKQICLFSWEGINLKLCTAKQFLSLKDWKYYLTCKIIFIRPLLLV